jgi:hypothetical protein
VGAVTASFATRGRVAVVDVRGSSAGDALTCVKELVATASGHHGGGSAAVDHALVLADAERLLALSAMFEALHRAHAFERVVCLAVGAGQLGADGGPALRVPSILDNSGSAVLWVADAKGVAWRLAGARRVQPPGEVMDDQRPALDRLTEVLGDAEVFDVVVALSRDMPGCAASPGLLVVSGDLRPGELSAAEAEAIRELVGGTHPAPDSLAAFPELDRELGPLLGAVPARTGDEPIVHGSEIDTRRRRVDEAVQAAVADLDRLAGPAGLVAPDRPGPAIWGRLVGAGRAIGGYRAAVAALLDQPTGIGAAGAAGLADVQRRGVICKAPAPVDRATVVKALRRTVEDGLPERSLHDLAGKLRAVIERASPRGTVGALDQLSSARAETLEDRLQAPQTFPLTLTGPALLTAAAVAAALASLWPPAGAFAGAAFVALWLLAVTMVNARRPVPGGELGWARAVQPALFAHLAAGAAGVSAGVLAGRMLAPPGWLAVLGIAAATGLLVTTVSRWWARSVRRWATAVGLGEAAAPGQGGAAAFTDPTGPYRRVLIDVARREWQQLEMRQFLCDAALAVAMALEDVADAFTTYVDGRGGHSDTADSWYRSSTAARSAEFPRLRAIAQSDLADAVRAAAADRWDRLSIGAHERFATGLAEDVLETVDQYERHLARYSVFVAPPFSTRGADREKLLDSVIAPSSEILGVLMSRVEDRFVQLCAAEQLGLLNAAPDDARMVKFAPGFARQRLTALVQQSGQAAVTYLGGVRWISGHLAGLLRLVPLRPGAADTQWATADDGEAG